MKTADYTEIDKAIVAAIETLPRRTFHDIFAVTGEIAKRLVDANPPTSSPLKQGRESTEIWRVVDRRLQALKRARKIVYRGRDWETVK